MRSCTAAAAAAHQAIWTPRDRLTCPPPSSRSAPSSTASYDLDAHERVFARVENLLDLRYEDPTGFLQPGLAAYGGVQLVY